MQQRIVLLEQYITQQQQQQQQQQQRQQQQQSTAQPSAEPQSSTNSPMTDIIEESNSLHSLETRPSYSWTPPPLLTEVLQLNSPLFPSVMMSNEEGRKLIDRYPNLEGTQYQPPDTIPLASRKMKPHQSKQDISLKRLQYLISGVFRPMDVLGLEISKDASNKNVQRYLLMLRDCRQLLLNVSAQVNKMRNNLAVQAINPTFTSSIFNNNNYTMPFNYLPLHFSLINCDNLFLMMNIRLHCVHEP
jgi:hypothetical protein